MTGYSEGRCLLAVLLVLQAGSVMADQCADLPPPSITVKRLSEPVSMNFQYGYGDLNNLGAALARPGRQILGLTRGTSTVRYEMKIPGFVDGANRWECASPQITLSYGFSPLTVYVAREFPPGTCAHQEIREHEFRHVKAYEQHVVSIEKEITDTLNQRFATGNVWRGPVGQTQTRLQQEMSKRWIPYVKLMLDRVEAAQAQIDTPAEYDRVAASCQGEIKNRLARRR